MNELFERVFSKMTNFIASKFLKYILSKIKMKSSIKIN